MYVTLLKCQYKSLPSIHHSTTMTRTLADLTDGMYIQNLLHRVVKLLSIHLAYAWNPMQFSQGAVYLCTNANMRCRCITILVYDESDHRDGEK